MDNSSVVYCVGQIFKKQMKKNRQIKCSIKKKFREYNKVEVNLSVELMIVGQMMDFRTNFCRSKYHKPKLLN